MSKINTNPYSATHDKLTGLPNSFLFYDRLNTIISISERSATRFSVIYIEFNSIRLISEKYAGIIKDSLLIYITERLNDSFREADTVAKLDEYSFGMIITHLVNKSSIGSLMCRIYKILSHPYQQNGHSLTLKLSMGTSVFPDNGVNATALTRYAIANAINYDLIINDY
jgi:diguanylate cyclase (GGDEF)-like protein